jgi:hypothetical protein
MHSTTLYLPLLLLCYQLLLLLLLKLHYPLCWSGMSWRGW